MGPDLLRFLTDEVIIEHFQSDDEYTDATYASPLVLAARVNASPRYLRTVERDDGEAAATVILDGDPGIGLRDRITLPDGKQPAIRQVHVAKDELGLAHHTRVYV